MPLLQCYMKSKNIVEMGANLDEILVHAILFILIPLHTEREPRGCFRKSDDWKRNNISGWDRERRFYPSRGLTTPGKKSPKANRLTLWLICVEIQWSQTCF